MTADTWRDQIAEAIDEHRLRTPVQCTCRWRETDTDTDTWAEHVADVVMPILEAALKQQAIDIEWAFRIRFSPVRDCAIALDIDYDPADLHTALGDARIADQIRKTILGEVRVS